MTITELDGVTIDSVTELDGVTIDSVTERLDGVTIDSVNERLDGVMINSVAVDSVTEGDAEVEGAIPDAIVSGIGRELDGTTDSEISSAPISKNLKNALMPYMLLHNNVISSFH